MEALILSCSTGGGHNAAARACQDALSRHGHHALLLDPYSLQGQDVADRVGNTYVDFVKAVPDLFGAVYRLGEAYTWLQKKIPHHSPVYWFQKRTVPHLQRYLEQARPDVILTTHVFAGEMLTMLRNRGVKLPPVLYIATDYTSIPFTQEVIADAYIVGHPDIAESFIKAGLPAWKVLPYGIPVDDSFQHQKGHRQARQMLGLDPDRRYLLLAGGSMGFGLDSMIEALKDLLQEIPDLDLLVLTGSNAALRARMDARYSGEAGSDRIRILGATDQMSLYMQACEAVLTKPGGLTTTEACVSRIPMILVHPIPGVETINAAFFENHGMAKWARDAEKEAPDLTRQVLQDPDPIREAQSGLQTNAAERIVFLAESLAER